MNNVQPNPGYALDDESLWPDWNSAHGTGKPAPESDNRSFEEIYEAQKAGARELREAKKPVHDA